MHMKSRAVATLAAAMMVGSTAAHANGEITYVSWGGSYQEAQRKAWLEPIAEEMGITIKEDTLNGTASVRTQVQSGTVTWDIVDVGSQSCVLLTKEGAFEPLDYDVVKGDGVPEDLKAPHWIGVIFYSTVLGWNTETVSNPPKNWAEFFDVENFPGGRTMYHKPFGTFEIALMADGVPKDEIYPIDKDRALKKLAQIRDEVVTWWQSGAASAQLIKDGEVEYAAIWNGRIQNAMKDGAMADLIFDGQVLDFDCLAIPKGAPNKDLAMKVIARIMEADMQARLPQFINYSPTNAKAFDFKDLISDEMAAALPSSPQNMEKAVVMDAVWWAEHADEYQEAFDLFKQM